MVCIPCFIIPVLLYIWHKFVQPILLKYWNPWEKKGVPAPQFAVKCEKGECRIVSQKSKNSSCITEGGSEEVTTNTKTQYPLANRNSVKEE